MTDPSSVVGERAAGCDPRGLVALGQRIQRGERRARGTQNEVGVSAGTDGALHRFDVRVQPGETTLEDVFIRLMSKAQEAGGG